MLRLVYIHTQTQTVFHRFVFHFLSPPTARAGPVADIWEVSLGKRRLIDHRELSLLVAEGEVRTVGTGGPAAQDICAVTANMILAGPPPTHSTVLLLALSQNAIVHVFREKEMIFVTSELQ